MSLSLETAPPMSHPEALGHPRATPSVAPPPRPQSSTAPVGLRAVLADYLELTKPRIALMVLLTVAVGYGAGARLGGGVGPLGLFGTLIGTAAVAGGAGVWNMVIERRRDALMRRTSRRPLPTGRVGVLPAIAFGSALATLGVATLAISANPLAAAVAASTFLLYVLAYTPLKSVTTLNTALGAIPGALPPVIGWAAATGELGAGAWSLFLLVFLWQFPHFLAIAWLHRVDYARAGLKMLPTLDPHGALTGRQAVVYGLALVPAGMLPAVVGVAGPAYYVGAFALGLAYLAAAVRFWSDPDDRTARGLLRASILYLPAVLLLLVLSPPI